MYFCRMVLVTGGTGLLGSHLLYELAKKDVSVRAIYRDKNRISRVKKLFDYYSCGAPHRFDSIEWVQADVLDLVSLEDALQGIQMVYHCAAMVSYNKKEFKKVIHVNRVGTSNMVNMSIKAGVEKFGYVSSTAAIGGIENVLVTEETKWELTDDTTGYSISKYNAEREVWRGSEEGMDVIIINPSIIFGAGDFNESSLAIFKTVDNGLKFYSTGGNSYVDARDVSTCLVSLMESSIKNERFLCVGHNLSFKTSIEIIASELGIKRPRFCPPKWLAVFFGRLNEIISSLTRSTPVVTTESARTAYSTMIYSNQKIKDALNIEFLPFEQTVKNVVQFKKAKRATH